MSFWSLSSAMERRQLVELAAGPFRIEEDSAGRASEGGAVLGASVAPPRARDVVVGTRCFACDRRRPLVLAGLAVGGEQQAVGAAVGEDDRGQGEHVGGPARAQSPGTLPGDLSPHFTNCLATHVDLQGRGNSNAQCRPAGVARSKPRGQRIALLEGVRHLRGSGISDVHNVWNRECSRLFFSAHPQANKYLAWFISLHRTSDGCQRLSGSWR